MSEDCQFWLNWLVQAAAAIATVAAVIVALFGNYLHSRFWPPRIKLTPTGLGDKPVRTFLRTHDGSQTGETLSWWCHLLVENERSWSPARELRVQLMSLATPDSRGDFQRDWFGEGIQLCWSHQQFKPATLTIPPTNVVDLFSIHKASPLEGRTTLKLHPLFRSLDLPADWIEPCKLAIVVQAKSLDGNSEPLHLEISWDGKWSDDAAKMKRHLTWVVK